MKKLTLIICLTLVSGFAFSQWVQQKSNDVLFSVYFPDANTGYAVGGHDGLSKPDPHQIILKTITGGTTWTTLSSGRYEPLYSVFFTDINTGYAVGMGGTIIKTTDGGINWIYLSSGTPYTLSAVFFTDAKTGYVVGILGIILKTIDGGTTWDTLSSGTSVPLKSVFFTDLKTGYAAGGRLGDGGGIILKTIDGGKTWTELSTIITDGSINSVFFTNADTGYAVGSHYYEGAENYEGGGIILKTTNGGTTWDTLSSGISVPLKSVFFTDVKTGYAVGGRLVPYLLN
jgi:photosystem II stability/assembly factor-like uncharacterized protein